MQDVLVVASRTSRRHWPATASSLTSSAAWTPSGSSLRCTWSRPGPLWPPPPAARGATAAHASCAPLARRWRASIAGREAATVFR